jgi:hypothetical protein
MEKITIQRDGEKDLEFSGELIAKGHTNEDDSSYYWSAESGRWSKYDLYKTDSGKFVLSVKHFSRWQGDIDEFSALVGLDLEHLLKQADLKGRAIHHLIDDLKDGGWLKPESI